MVDMRNFGSTEQVSVVDKAKSYIPAWLTWKTALAVYGLRAASGYLVFREASKKYSSQGDSPKVVKAKAASASAVLSTLLTIPVGYYIATREEQNSGA